MRPAPLLVVAFVAWAALGVATSFGWLPSHAWPLTGAAIAIAALLDLLRLRRRATPEVVREMPEALPIGIERAVRSEEHTSELQSLMRISYAVFCLKKKKHIN